MSTRTRSRRTYSTDEAPVMTYDEVVAAFPGEYILWIVTSDELGLEMAGKVLAHARTQAAVNKRLAKEPPRSQRPAGQGPYSVFRAEPRITTGEEWRKLLDRLASDETYVEPRL